MAQQSGETMTCVECGNIVSIMYVEDNGDIWCVTCWDTKCEEEEEAEKEDE